MHQRIVCITQLLANAIVTFSHRLENTLQHLESESLQALLHFAQMHVEGKKGHRVKVLQANSACGYVSVSYTHLTLPTILRV